MTLMHPARLALVVGLAAVALAGCSGAEKTARFLIDPPMGAAQAPNRLGTAELKDVSLPEYASNQEVAYQTADGAVRSTPKNLWADNPQRAFTQTLARAISDGSGATVIAEPWPLAEPPQRVLEVRVEKALAQADNQYRLSGRYFVSDSRGGGANHSRSFDITVPMASESPAAAAAATSQAIAILAGQIGSLSGPGRTIATSQSAAPDPFTFEPMF